MKTDGLSINLATVRHQFDLKTGVEALVKHGIRGVSPWREHVQAVGAAEAARIIKSNGMKGTGYCRGAVLAGGGGRGGGRPRLPRGERRRHGPRPARYQGSAGALPQRHGGDPAARARAG